MTLLLAKEQYVFHYLSLIDMERVIRSLDHIDETPVMYPLFRDAVICYAKPFSGNRSISGKERLRLSEAFVPAGLSASHTEVIGLRNQLFAHMDLDKHAPLVPLEKREEKKYFGLLSVSGYERVFTDHLLEPLRKLALAGQSYLHQELQAMRSIERSDA